MSLNVTLKQDKIKLNTQGNQAEFTILNQYQFVTVGKKTILQNYISVSSNHTF